MLTQLLLRPRHLPCSGGFSFWGRLSGAPFYRGGSQGSEMSGNFPNIPQHRKKVGIQTQALLAPEPKLWLQSLLPPLGTPQSIRL